MRQIHRILHPTDFSANSREALKHALHLAKRFEARVQVLHVVPTFGEDPIRGAFQAHTDEKAFYQQLHREVGQRLEALLDEWNEGGISVDRQLVRGDAPEEEILEQARRGKSQLIVMGTHGRRGVRRLLLGSVTEDVLHRTSCPVLTVPRKVGGKPFRQLLVPVDFSEYADVLIEAAVTFAEHYNAHLHLLHVIEPMPLSKAAREELTISELVTDVRERAEQRLDRMRSQMSTSEGAVTMHMVEGDAVDEIIRAADRERADLIIIAKRGESGAKSPLLGSVTERVVRRAPHPVLVIK